MKKNYTTSEINRNFKIKVFGFINGVKINTLVGVSGLIRILNGDEAKAQNREDAQKVCKVLNITLTHRQYDGTRIPMAGFPFHALDTYLPKLVRAGLRVAICDEMKSGKKGVVETHKK